MVFKIFQISFVIREENNRFFGHYGYVYAVPDKSDIKQSELL